VIWTSKLQTEIATSTMESEYIALAIAMRDLLPFKRLFLAVAHGISLDKSKTTTFKTTVWEDNLGALYHWFHSHLKPNEIEIEKIDMKLQRADILMKGLQYATFKQI
jgi:hypothetical protein